MNPKEEIKKLKEGECWIWPESDYGKAEIWCKNQIYFLFEIPLYGGLPSFVGAYHSHSIEDMLGVVNSWT